MNGHAQTTGMDRGLPKPAAEQHGWSELWKKEDYWAIWMGLGMVLLALLFFYGGSSFIKSLSVVPPSYTDFSAVSKHLAAKWGWYAGLYLFFVVLFTISSNIMGFNAREFIVGFTILFVLSLLILIVGSQKTVANLGFEPPLLALLLGLVVSNLFRLPKWLDTVFRTEYYVKTGIVLLGATLPFTLIIQAGPIAFLQATIIAVCTFVTIYLAATRLFGLEKPFGATLAAGGSICGVSASIALGGAVKAKKEHVSIAISMVVIWALVMIFVLPIVSKIIGLPAGVAGAWIGTSEFADAAGFAAAAAIGDEAAIRSFTLLKVVGRDIWVGLWSLIMAIIACTMWERGNSTDRRERVNAMEIWWRFPKFVIGFFLASVIITLVSLQFSAAEFNKVLTPAVIGPIKNLRTWTFVFTFLSIGFTTRFRELTSFGWKPLLAFAIGVAINVPLGYILSVLVFGHYWANI
ncbi:putative sulfate exporter family transporter [Desulfofundulus thermobenzoicus]|uniref:Putative sulfate exporter family transporter n=1 Tax=Desulfofundulus thermobenzoicus TaxID=29376 RepID=A0A6N7INB8_9FIRM|nr:putative sulfate exporter family transporter [Desulfofundulus thermobenzoicus]HHW43059.1 putative sulfate exporter family transporter [Desulfotomaculum sp.]